jgi:hypothetical protein
MMNGRKALELGLAPKKARQPHSIRDSPDADRPSLRVTKEELDCNGVPKATANAPAAPTVLLTVSPDP